MSLLGEIAPPKWLSDAEDLLWLQVQDGLAPSLTQLADVAQFLDSSIASRMGVLIFCGAGMGRAPTAYAAWRMRTAGMDAAAALAETCKARSVASPTVAQRTRLEEWQRFLEG